MKAIILAAGRGTRLQPLTNTIPKPMIQVCWKPILEYLMESIYSDVSEIILIVKYKKEIIKEYFWDKFNNTKISYITQWEEKGTGWALKGIDLDDHVLILNGDSIIDSKDIKQLIQSHTGWMLVESVNNPEIYGVCKVDKSNNVQKIIEKPNEFVWNLVSLWAFKFSPDIFRLIQNLELSSRWEYEITDAVNNYVKENVFQAIEISWDFIDIWYPWDILTANSHFLNKLEQSEIKWTVEDWVTIKWNIVLEEWAILKSWTYIEWNCYIGKNSSIGPHTYLRWETVIWQDCKIWNAVEVKNSCFWDKVSIAHLSYIWDSIMWNNINIGWWFIAAPLRNDDKNIRVMVQNKLVDTGKRKFWVIVWDNVKTAINTSTMPGRRIDTWVMTMPWEIVK
jgi:UDP-N-acetylglucosamine diphosphorylase / glucose-1-phosphate thymidylyltransferase / UDP-N-acetylgalactosamine diphosphorylase / glucosamine-1-phosphate N-acetyltransferase / galactosamine-1-phosphate N-acetyltransferase